MTEGTPKAIEPKGIVRNATKIGVQDGQAEDLINLRFMDGSWRASGNGRQIYTPDRVYSNIYIHINVYRHVIGIYDGSLYWFANIDSDGNFENIAPVKLLENVSNDILYANAGHALVMIDGSTRSGFLFKRAINNYELIEQYNNEAAEVNPYGSVQFRCVNNVTENGEPEVIVEQLRDIFPGLGDTMTEGSSDYMANQQTVYTGYTNIIANMKKDNSFHGCFLACLALRTYDGNYTFASAPVLVNPSFYGDMLEDSVPIVQAASSTMYDPVYMFSLCGLKDVKKVFSGSCQKYSYDGRGTLDVSLTENLYHSCGKREVYVGSTGKTHPVDGNNGYQRFGFKDWDYLPTIGDFELGTDARSGIVFPYYSQPHVFYGKSNHLEFRFDKLEIDPAIYTHLAVFVTPVFDRLDISTMNIMNGSKNGSNDRTPYMTKGRATLKIKAGQGIQYNPVTGQLVSDSGNAEGDYVFYSAAFPNRQFLYDNLNKLKKGIQNSIFYLIKEIPTSTLLSKGKEWVSVELEDGMLENLLQQQILKTDAFGLSTSFVAPKVVYSYNGRIHYANYLKSISNVFKSDSFFDRDYSDGGRLVSFGTNYNASRVIDVKEIITPATGHNREDIFEEFRFKYSAFVGIATDEDNSIVSTEQPIESPTQYIIPSFLTIFPAILNSLVGYINHFESETLVDSKRFSRTYSLEKCTYYQLSFDIGFTKFTEETGKLPIIAEDEYPNVVKVKDQPNGLAVSAVDNPFYFPAETVYQIGNSEILALMSNTIAVGTGQTGDAPLYVFCKDGVYALYVDSSGQMAYPNARILARDVCNNPRSVTPIDAGVVFTTDRGLMMIAGEQVQEIGAPAEGDVVQFWNAGSVDYSKIATASMQQVAGLPSNLCSTTDFLTYLQDKGRSGKAAIINYNHNMRELMVSNPNYPYSYVLDREGNWSRRDYTASQYVNNYPTSYRVDADGHFYKVDDEGDANTSLEHRKEADNKIFYLSNVIKLDSIGFKQAYRFVVRGYFETLMAPVERVERVILQKSIDSSNFYIEDSHVLSQTNLPVMNHLVGMSDVTNGLQVGDVLVLNPIGNPLAEEQEIVITEVTRDDVYLAEDVVITEGVTGFSLSRKRTVIDHVPTNVACVVEGSYDGRKFKPLGYNRKSGKFRDIGCIVERTDVRFFRICLSGQVTGKTRIDYMEMSAGASMLNTKIR